MKSLAPPVTRSVARRLFELGEQKRAELGAVQTAEQTLEIDLTGSGARDDESHPDVQRIECSEMAVSLFPGAVLEISAHLSDDSLDDGWVHPSECGGSRRASSSSTRSGCAQKEARVQSGGASSREDRLDHDGSTKPLSQEGDRGKGRTVERRRLGEVVTEQPHVRAHLRVDREDDDRPSGDTPELSHTGFELLVPMMDSQHRHGSVDTVVA